MKYYNFSLGEQNMSSEQPTHSTAILICVFALIEELKFLEYNPRIVVMRGN